AIRSTPLASNGRGVASPVGASGPTTSIGDGTHPVSVPKQRARLRALSTAAAIAVVGWGAAWSATHLPRPVSDANLVVVAPFEIIGAGNPDLREGLLDLVSASLDGAGPLRAVPASRVLKLWPVGARADSSSAAALARVARAGL